MSLGVPVSASAADRAHYGHLTCSNVFAPNTGTESTARGTNVKHKLVLSTGISLSATLGSSNYYAPWGWTFWHGVTSTLFVSSASGVNSAILAGSMKRFCTFY